MKPDNGFGCDAAVEPCKASSAQLGLGYGQVEGGWLWRVLSQGGKAETQVIGQASEVQACGR